LNNAWQAASQDMYNATGGNPGDMGGDPNQGTSGDAGNKGADEVQDVDFEEVK